MSNHKFPEEITLEELAIVARYMADYVTEKREFIAEKMEDGYTREQAYQEWLENYIMPANDAHIVNL